MTRVFDHSRRPFQPDRALDEAEIAAWEQSAGIKLPGDYRGFMRRCNGGSLRPFAFDLTVPDSDFKETVHALDYLYDWAEVGKRSQWRIEPEFRNIPPGRLAIGATVSQLTVTLRIDEPGFGAIEAWVRDTYNLWGKGANTQILPLADSFGAFLALLHDSAEVYHGFWVDFDRAGQVAQSLVLP